MGEVTFCARVMLLRTSEGYPYVWATEEPSEERERTSGKLQVCLLDVSESIKPTAPSPQAPLKLSAGLNLSIPKSSLRGSIASAKAPVLLHIYDVGVDKNVKMKNMERKSVLRSTIGKELPPSILKASKKGFEIPLTVWFKSPKFQPKHQEMKKTLRCPSRIP